MTKPTKQHLKALGYCSRRELNCFVVIRPCGTVVGESYTESVAWERACVRIGREIRESQVKHRLFAIINDEAKEILAELGVTP